MIVVTGGAGFIGSNLVKALNDRGCSDVIVVDDLTDGAKFINIADCKFHDYLDKDDFISRIEAGQQIATPIQAMFHQGACSDTTEFNGRYMMQNNYEYSKALLHYCLKYHIPYLYASSASVYGSGPVFKEDAQYERPLNPYAYSKFLFDRYVRRLLPTCESQVVGLRYFNVYGPREQHKGKMASIVYQFSEQLKNHHKLRLFKGSDGYGDGEQRRDFICVEDAVDVNLWLLAQPQVSGVLNLGTGNSQTFNEVARAVIGYYADGEIEYIPFPEPLKGRYQSFTRADISALRAAGYSKPFNTVEQSIPHYLQWLDQRHNPSL